MGSSGARSDHVLLPNAASPIPLPMGWVVDEAAGALTLVGPEGDIRVLYAVAPKTGGPAHIAAHAWRMVDDGFDWPLVNHAETASTTGWEAVHEMTYGIPAAHGRCALAVLRTLNERAYVNLVWGTKASLSRRLAQIGEIIEAWRPDGIADVDLVAREPVVWSAKESEALNGFMDAAMQDLKIPGAAMAIVQNGEIVFARGFGVTSVDDPSPVTTETRFMIGSTTKSLTTLMMARLVELGRFAWTTPVTDLLPGFALADPEVTAKLQMRHTVGAGTGMPRRDTDLVFWTKDTSASDRMAEMKGMKPTTGFGETFQYSNYLVAAGGYAAARAFTEEGSLETAYDNAMRELVFKPLGMTKTRVLPRADDRDDEAAPHALDVGGNAVALDRAIERFVDAVAPAGAAWSTVSDIARYIMCELRGEAPQARRAPQTKIDGKSSYGLGLFLTQEYGITVIGHGGNTLGFSADMFFLPDKGIGAVILTNCYAANAFLSSVRQCLFELVFAAPRTSSQTVSSAAKSKHEAIESVRERVKADANSIAWLEEWIGEYRCSELGTARIVRTASGYRIDFESWGSELGSETQHDGGKLIVLISPPWSGSLRLQPAQSGKELVLDAAQIKHVFTKA
jgi:CubicO group peptidase (beta-lactamase class C family)